MAGIAEIATVEVAAPKICEVGGGGFILPLGGDNEQRWPQGLRLVLYLVGLGYCFLGVALVADLFMGAIERITSKKTRKKNPTTNRHHTVLVWNATVANLTLMALGSSAPEILLSVIELLTNNFFSGDLGPSTIVGSAAFNLLVITAVCVMAIPDGEVRYIKEMPVYVITASFSVAAYVWLLVILMCFSPNVIEVWEGVLTFLFFPVLVILAYLADQGYFATTGQIYNPSGRASHVISSDITIEELAELEAKIRRKHGGNLSDEQVAKIAEVEYSQPTSKAAYRVAATRTMTGGKRVITPDHSSGGTTSLASKNYVVPLEEETVPMMRIDNAILEFAVDKYAVLENAGSVAVQVVRSGNEMLNVSVEFQTVEGTAKNGEDFRAVSGKLEFKAGETKRSINIGIVDDIAFEGDEVFYVELIRPPADHVEVQLGERYRATVTIIDDDLPGVLKFEQDEITLTEDVSDRVAEIAVQRSAGSTGHVGCKYTTEDATAFAGHDYDATSGVLQFEPGEMSKIVRVNIRSQGKYERSEMFRLVLSEAYGGATFDAECDGGPTQAILTVVIQSEAGTKARVDKLMNSLNVNWDKSKIASDSWADQFRNALLVNGGDDDDSSDSGQESQSPSVTDWAMHICLVPWKLLFATVPPVEYCDGWACFVCALCYIGGVTAIIGDMAGLLGCVMDIPDEITAISFVALGTSLPDTFASKTAATQDPYADASIGNVTGSNSVNVFLGLGLSWMVGAIRWSAIGPNEEWERRYRSKSWVQAQVKPGDAVFIVEAGNLAFSVVIFCVCAVATIIVLYIRRGLCGGELGGPRLAKITTAAYFVMLWLLYVGLSSWYTLRRRDD